MRKYDRLQDMLAHHPGPQIRLPFLAIEKILHGSLPQSARVYAAWWANEDPTTTRHVHSRAWTLTGWQASPNLDLGEVVFRRVAKRG